MGQLFAPRANTLFRVALGLAMLSGAALGWGGYRLLWSSYVTGVNVPISQPVQFSHEHHVGGLGIDCRYCHTSVEKGAFAGIPATEICMTCHSQVWADAPYLAPVRESLARNRPLRWTRVNDLPDYVYFNHSIHVSKGVACASCHGALERMPLTAKAHTLYMRWCLDCHRSAHSALAAKAQVFEAPPADSGALERAHWSTGVNPSKRLEDCSVCHR